MKQWKKVWGMLLCIFCMTILLGVTGSAKAVTSPNQVIGLWDGTYDGNWIGEDGRLVDVDRHVTFSISKCTNAGNVSGTVYISAISGKQYQYNGSYRFSGTLDYESGKLTMNPGDWKKRIPNFNRSSFQGTMNGAEKTFTGFRVIGSSDSGKYRFSIRKLSDSAKVTRITHVAINQTSAELYVGETLQLKSTVSPCDIKNASFTWKSSKPEIASVSRNGKVTAKKAGKTIITCKATYKGSSMTVKCEVTVKSKDVAKYKQSVRIKDAQSGNNVSKATVNFRKGYNKKSGSVYKTGKSDSSGILTASLAKGKYTAEVKKSGYITTYVNLECTGNTKKGEEKVISISKVLDSGEYRVVLTWGQTPRDLDSHLTGPLKNGGRFHVYFSSKNAYDNGKKVANLDIDDTSSEGPETVTINFNVGAKGVYRYSVHDYTNRYEKRNRGLSASGARVVLYKGNKQIASYTVPKNKEGTLWTVFEINNGKVKKINTMSDASSASGIS